MNQFSDKVGIGWRAEIAGQICENVDTHGDIQFVEVIAEHYFRSPKNELDALAAFARDVPIALHGVSLGLATHGPLAIQVVDQMARLCEAVRPMFWSEHLSFVRAGGYEIGHLAAPPWTGSSAETAIKNAARAAQIVGQAPALENIATLIYPPCSDLKETAWTNVIIAHTSGGMLLDLHNLYANAINFGLEYMAMLEEFPLHEVKQIHLSGGVEIPAPQNSSRLLDDHAHDVADPCYEMLEKIAASVNHPLVVVIERDGRYPPFGQLLDQIRRAKAALRAGRSRNAVWANGPGVVPLFNERAGHVWF